MDGVNEGVAVVQTMENAQGLAVSTKDLTPRQTMAKENGD